MHGCAMMPAWIGSPWLRYGAVALLAAGAAWTAQGWRMDAALAKQQSGFDQAMSAASAEALQRQHELQGKLDAQQERWALAEAKQYKELRNAEVEIERLRADVDAGRQRLRVRATCPASGTAGVPEAGTASGVDHGATAELDQAARSDYFALRAGIERVTQQLAACQARLLR